jgi:DNA primase large subunit
MKNLHRQLRADSHLRFGGRRQYGLFLKGIGLSMEEALIFWRKAFSIKFTEDQFAKNYSYSIRHNYGQEGKRADYTPYSCIKIINGDVPSGGEHHGCPFRHFNQENLKTTLRHSGANEGGIHEVLELVKQNHYQIACTRFYEITHKLERQIDPIQHPNQYFDLTRKATEILPSSSSSSTSTTSLSTKPTNPLPATQQNLPDTFLDGDDDI